MCALLHALLMQVGSYSYDMTKMLFRISQLTFIQKQSIILDYNIKILNLMEKDKIFLSGALGNYSLAGFQMVCVRKKSHEIVLTRQLYLESPPSRHVLHHYLLPSVGPVCGRIMDLVSNSAGHRPGYGNQYDGRKGKGN